MYEDIHIDYYKRNTKLILLLLSTEVRVPFINLLNPSSGSPQKVVDTYFGVKRVDMYPHL